MRPLPAGGRAGGAHSLPALRIDANLAEAGGAWAEAPLSCDARLRPTPTSSPLPPSASSPLPPPSPSSPQAPAVPASTQDASAARPRLPAAAAAEERRPRGAACTSHASAARREARESGSGSGADDEAGSEDDTASEASSLAAVRELGLLSRRGGEGSDGSSASEPESAISEEEIATSEEETAISEGGALQGEGGGGRPARRQAARRVDGGASGFVRECASGGGVYDPSEYEAERGGGGRAGGSPPGGRAGRGGCGEGPLSGLLLAPSSCGPRFACGDGGVGRAREDDSLLREIARADSRWPGSRRGGQRGSLLRWGSAAQASALSAPDRSAPTAAGARLTSPRPPPTPPTPPPPRRPSLAAPRRPRLRAHRS